MGRMYTAAFSGESSAVSLDLIELACGAADVIAVHEISVSQLSEIGDVEEEMLLLEWKSGVTTGSGGSAGTTVPVLVGDPASGATVENANPTKATGGAGQYAWYWNVRMPFLQIFTPETRPILSPSRVAVLTQSTTPADSITYGGYIVFEEIG
jgi:hypothetical protein